MNIKGIAVIGVMLRDLESGMKELVKRERAFEKAIFNISEIKDLSEEESVKYRELILKIAEENVISPLDAALTVSWLLRHGMLDNNCLK